MKTSIYMVFVFLFTSMVAYTQNEVDALRYSQIFYGGTARSMSMGGAFGSLGGDFSSLSINPAGIGIFRASEMTFSPTVNFSSVGADYLGNSYTDSKYSFNFNNIGMVTVLNSGADEGWVNFNMGFGYNRVNNFNKNILIQGINNNNSMTDYFAGLANGQTPESLVEGAGYFAEGLAWDAYIIDPIDSLQNQYTSVMKNYGETQRKSISSKGSMGEYFFSMGANYSHKFYIGGSVGIQTVKYTENSIYSEFDESALIDSFASFTYKQHIATSGTGFNFKLGTIFRPIDWFRLGFAIHTPTFFVLEDNYKNTLSSEFDSGETFELNSPEGTYNYEVTTPMRAIGSIAFVIKKAALLSVDYEFVDYSSIRMRANDYDFYAENSNIQMNYTAVSNIHVGAEYKIGPFSFRGGYALYGNPYNSNNVNNKKIISSYSGGFGIRDEKFFFDLAYVYSKYNENYYLYDSKLVNVEPVAFKNTNSQVVATFGFKF